MVNAVWRVVLAGIVLIAGWLISLPTAPVHAQGELELGEIVENTMRGRPDRFFFDVPEDGQLVVFRAESDEMDMTLTLYDVHYDRLAYDDDGGEGTNALLIYRFETGGTYGIKVNAYGDDDSGHYTLSAMIVEPTLIELDNTYTFDLVEEPMFVTFESTAGTVINLTSLSQTLDVQVELALYDPQGEVLATDYFYGYDSDYAPNFFSPSLRRLFLPSDGLYLIKLVPYFYEVETASIDIMLETTEALWLSADPYEIELGGDLPWEVFAIDAVAGTTHRVIVTCEGEVSINLTLYAGEDMNYYLYGTGGSRIAWDFEPEESGILRLSVSSEYSDEKSTYTVAVEVVE